MKNVFLCRMILLTSLSFILVFTSQAREKESDNYRDKNVLILGLRDNVKSNYFHKGMITEKTGITENMIDKEYNTIITENIIASTSSKDFGIFIPVSAETSVYDWANLIKVEGEGDKCFSDVSPIPTDEYRKALNMAGAEYLLVVNQHYLKWQEKPMRTLFHIVSYTLYDKDQKEVYCGNTYFTSMDIEHPENLKKISRKASSRIASAIVNQIKINEV